MAAPGNDPFSMTGPNPPNLINHVLSPKIVSGPTGYNVKLDLINLDNSYIQGTFSGNYVTVINQNVAIGQEAGQTGQQSGAVAIGERAGISNQGINTVAVGSVAGGRNQGGFAVAVGSQAGLDGQGVESVAIGFQSGQTFQGRNSVAVGTLAGHTQQGASSVAIGYEAGRRSQGTGSVAIGDSSGEVNQQPYSIAIGYQAGMGNTNQQESNTIILNASGSAVNGVTGQTGAFYVKPVRNDTASGLQTLKYNTTTSEITYGPSSGGITQVGTNFGNYLYWDGSAWVVGDRKVSIGSNAGQNVQGNDSVAIGTQAGFEYQGVNAVAIGNQAGFTGQGIRSVAVGQSAGNRNQGLYSVGVGGFAAFANQGIESVAVGFNAGNNTQGAYSVAVGADAGHFLQGTGSVAIGHEAGRGSQGPRTVAIGDNAGFNNQGTGSVAIGAFSGERNQQPYSIAIGYQAGHGNTNQQEGNTIILNASGSAVNGVPGQTGSFYVNPVRVIQSSANFGGPMFYNSATREIAVSNNDTYSLAITDYTNNNKSYIYADNGTLYWEDAFKSSTNLFAWKQQLDPTGTIQLLDETGVGPNNVQIAKAFNSLVMNLYNRDMIDIYPAVGTPPASPSTFQATAFFVPSSYNGSVSNGGSYVFFVFQTSNLPGALIRIDQIVSVSISATYVPAPIYGDARIPENSVFDVIRSSASSSYRVYSQPPNHDDSFVEGIPPTLSVGKSVSSPAELELIFGYNNLIDRTTAITGQWTVGKSGPSAVITCLDFLITYNP